MIFLSIKLYCKCLFVSRQSQTEWRQMEETLLKNTSELQASNERQIKTMQQNLTETDEKLKGKIYKDKNAETKR